VLLTKPKLTMKYEGEEQEIFQISTAYLILDTSFLIMDPKMRDICELGWTIDFIITK